MSVGHVIHLFEPRHTHHHPRTQNTHTRHAHAEKARAGEGSMIQTDTDRHPASQPATFRRPPRSDHHAHRPPWKPRHKTPSKQERKAITSVVTKREGGREGGKAKTPPPFVHDAEGGGDIQSVSSSGSQHGTCTVCVRSRNAHKYVCIHVCLCVCIRMGVHMYIYI